MSSRISDFIHALYDPKKKQFLGRDGAGWAKLGVFYFFFYLGLAGFFCAMLAVFMAFSPRDHPEYIVEASRMTTRSNPLTPGLGFRPQPEPDKNIIIIDKNAPKGTINPYAKSLDQYLQIYYWKDTVESGQSSKTGTNEKFIIHDTGACNNESQYGYGAGQPCVLVKMNKIVGFIPEPGSTNEEETEYGKTCTPRNDAIAIHCHGEYPSDMDNMGNITYRSENGMDNKCGSLLTERFPYKGKVDRKDVYQAPYFWVQFLNPKPNVLINVLCRAYGKNIYYDKKTARAITRFQIYVKENRVRSTRQAGEF